MLLKYKVEGEIDVRKWIIELFMFVSERVGQSFVEWVSLSRFKQAHDAYVYYRTYYTSETNHPGYENDKSIRKVNAKMNNYYFNLIFSFNVNSTMNKICSIYIQWYNRSTMNIRFYWTIHNNTIHCKVFKRWMDEYWAVQVGWNQLNNHE